VTLPKCLARSTDPEALAIASHELGHAEQRIFLLGKIILYVIAPIVLVLGFFLIESAITAATVLCCCALIVLLTAPLVTVLYEVNASKRGLVNLIAYNYINSETAAERAAYALQLAASTYMSGMLTALFRFFIPSSQENQIIA
jgi:Zn-dependent membrane protease YugP